MDKTALVEAELKLGKKIVHDVERLGIPVDLAAWFQHESLDWQLVISSPELKRDGGTDRVYDAIYAILADLEGDGLEMGDVLARLCPSGAVHGVSARSAAIWRTSLRRDFLHVGVCCRHEEIPTRRHPTT